ncbi:uncharacterized protein H6S33_012071 [Morchella sextelata]|uniref:uncharacterized protein n=1 Tax=Morchella sextelata TaxID=1174677 RepID=UPI001D036BFF|nr:uncharacterized protein H6S33_012071 [Morchella sextelata]KAH0610544.1 hypothetical protein H6S33_012071 [Morchella sextelata]
MDHLKKWSRKLKGSQDNTPPRPINPAYNFPPAPHPSECSPDNGSSSYGPPPSEYPPDSKSSYGPSEYPPDNKSSYGPPPTNTHTYAAPPFPPSGGSSSTYPHDSEASDGAPPVYTPSPTSTYTDGYKPPAFPPPSSTTPEDLPPPPSIPHEVSPAFNSTRALSSAGHRFTALNPLFPPQQFPHTLLSSLPTHPPAALPLAPPPRHFRGSVAAVNGGVLVEARGTEDTCLASAAPLFAAGYHHPANTRRARVFGYEVMVLALPREAALVAVGFLAAPYPLFRLPGWHRGSLGVHSDDGRRYCNDDHGGRDFGAPFRAGERIGISMRFPVDTGGRGIEIFVTRDGKPAGDWRLYEEMDSQRGKNPAEGLDGSRDIYAAIGVWGSGLRVVVDNFYSREE